MLQEFATQNPEEQLSRVFTDDFLGSLGEVEVAGHHDWQAISLSESKTNNCAPHVSLNVHDVEFVVASTLTAIETLSRASEVGSEREFPVVSQWPRWKGEETLFDEAFTRRRRNKSHFVTQFL